MGCAADGDVPKEDGTNPAEIIAGTEATSHPEACVIAFDGYVCSGSLIAPNVVLTAGHCVHGVSSWRVNCPYSRDTATVTGSMGEAAPNYPNRDNPGRATIDNNAGSDVGLIRLDRPLNETRVGRVRFGGVAVGTSVFAMGRIHSGVTNRMYASPVFMISVFDRVHSYWAGVDRTVIEAGDSGGPLVDSNTNEIVGVNSAGIDAASCRRGSSCDEWAMLGAASTWFNATISRYTGGASTTPPPPPPPAMDACGAQTSCASCTAQSACGWCNGHCVTGTSSGGSTCTSAAGNWMWTGNQCSAATPPPPPPPATDSCSDASSCNACTSRASCGWRNGRCVTGTASGGATCTNSAGNWMWTSNQCSAPPDSCTTSTSCSACTARATCGWCGGRCLTGSSSGPNGTTCGGNPWSWVSSSCR
jgi:V8-like Glu-specific endopeptidase